MNISAWGHYPVIDSNVEYLKAVEQMEKILKHKRVLIPYGNGRSYGDQALSENIVITRKYNYITAFDSNKGIISCQSGVTLEEVLDVIVPKGWFLPVTPGTKYITIGGAIASDVHGKNHHKEGTFSDHVVSFDLLLPYGQIVSCSRTKNKELFHATCGGNGLTGIILNATFKLKPVESAYIAQTSIKAKNIDELVALIEENESYTYSVAWIDCVARGKHLGRGILLCGEHARVSELPGKYRKNPLILSKKSMLNVPLFFPDFVLNKYSIAIFNALYYHKTKMGKTESIIDYNSFFYPLDAIHNWNRIYGKRGFTQYQFVVPKEVGIKGVRDIVQRISDNGMGSFLAVLKTFGKDNGNYLSFPKEGYTLALDFPISKQLFKFLDELDKVIENYNGRLYTTKDVRMKADFFKKGYPLVQKFIKVRKKIKADKSFQSLQSRRLQI